MTYKPEFLFKHCTNAKCKRYELHYILELKGGAVMVICEACKKQTAYPKEES